MEAKVEQTVSNIMSQPDVIGVLCTDSNGLCLASQGKVPPKYSGYVRSLAIRSRQLAEAGADPLICVESESMRVLITDQNDEVTVAIFKSK